MTALRTRNGAFLFEVEAVEGTAETPSASTDAVLVENPNIRFNPQNTETREVTGSLDNRGPIVGGMQVQVTFDVYLKGSGAAGTAPEVGEVLRACGWAETVTSTAVPAAAEACAAGGSTTTAVLGASAAATADLYRGMPIDFTGVVEGSSFITDYTVGKLATLTDTMSGAIVATTNYQIPVNVLYKPASTSIPSGTIYLYMDGVLYIVAGARGTWSLSAAAAGPGKFSFTFSGMFVSKTDASVPACTYDSTRPPIFKGGKMLINRVAAAMQTFALDNGNQVVYPGNPNASEGFDPAIITERGMSGSIDPQATLVATRDIMTAMRAGTQQIIHARWGSTAGNRVGITIPTALYTANDPGDRQGIMTEQTNFACIGQDAGAFICLY